MGEQRGEFLRRVDIDRREIDTSSIPADETAVATSPALTAEITTALTVEGWDENAVLGGRLCCLQQMLTQSLSGDE